MHSQTKGRPGISCYMTSELESRQNIFDARAVRWPVIPTIGPLWSFLSSKPVWLFELKGKKGQGTSLCMVGYQVQVLMTVESFKQGSTKYAAILHVSTLKAQTTMEVKTYTHTQIYLFYECFVCMHVCVPYACLWPMEVNGVCQKPLELNL